jgi:hypothetical protein
MTPPERRAKNDRFANFYLTASALVMIALVVTVVILVLRISAVSSDEHQSAIVACQLANANRTEDVDIWVSVLKLPPDATAAQKAAVARDLAKVHQAYALRDCATLYSTKG